MRNLTTCAAAAIFGLMLLTAAHANDGIKILYQEPLEQLRFAYPTSSGELKPGTEARSLQFDAFGKRFDINLEVNRALLDTAQRAQLGGRYEIYRGDIEGLQNSWVRLVVVDSVPRGMLWDGTELLAIDVETDAVTGIEKAFIYRLSDLQIPPGALACAAVGPLKNGGELAKAVLSEVAGSSSQAPGASSQIDFAVIGDYEFTSAQLLDAGAALTTRMNNVDGIFSAQLGVQLNVNRIDTFAANDDPFTESDSSLLLDELTDYRSSTPAQYDNGLTHLFTGRDLDTTTVGIAYTGALCSRGFGAGLTQGTHGVTMDSLIAAHEIGHNFGAPHDGTSGSPCESETGEFLMAPRLNGSDEFSACSITEIQDDVNRARAFCISPMPGTDTAIVAGGQPAPVLLGDTATVTFDANSIGTEDASGVNVDVTIPAGVNLRSVSATGGNCTSGGGTANCVIGPVAAGSGETVTITADTTAVGDFDFVANITADTDANGNNNQATVRQTVNTAVDLVATAAATAQVALDSSTTIRPSIENRSSIVATNVTLTVTPNAGINVDSASWSPGSCSIASNVVTCQAGSLAAQSNNILQLGVTGTSDGNQSYAMSVSAAETDRLPSNNSANGQVNVGVVVINPPAESGGGAIGWLALLLLILSAMLTHAARNRNPLVSIKDLSSDH